MSSRSGTRVGALLLLIALGLAGCTSAAPSSPARSPTAPPADPIAIVQGTWVFVTTDADMTASGVSDGGVIDENAGSTVIAMDGTTFAMHSTSQAGYQVSSTDGTGTLTAKDGVLTIHWSPVPSESTEVVPHAAKGGGISFTRLRTNIAGKQEAALDRAIFLRRPWVPLTTLIAKDWTVDVASSDLDFAQVPDAAKRAGPLTLGLHDGGWTLARGGAPAETGAYELHGSALTLHWTDDADATTTATLIPTPEGGLVFADVVDGPGRSAGDAAYDVAAFGTNAWTPVG